MGFFIRQTPENKVPCLHTRNTSVLPSLLAAKEQTKSDGGELVIGAVARAYQIAQQRENEKDRAGGTSFVT
jgi:hypothetical protein